MTVAEGTITVRSFRVCFDLERRIHRIDRWRLPMPYGLPVRSIGYWAAALVVVVALGRLPLAGELLAALPVPLRLVILPAGIAYLLTQLRIDGRSAHSAAVSLARHALAPRELVAFRPVAKGERRLGDIRIARDETSCRYRRATVRGPAAVTLRYPATALRRGQALRLRQSAGEPMWRGKRVVLDDGQRLELR